ncbi:MAG TPA: DUF5709 domain-containing protein, partial [Pseudonocardia sp.]|nr:DUF5709 domain-containing protein [Pseudonocardia sp.]
EAPDLGASVQLESSETLAGPAGDRDGVDAGYVPADRPYVLDERGVTAEGQREGDTLDERLAREQPEDLPSDPDRAGRLQMAGEGAALETSDSVAAEDVGISGGAASAEEAAMHYVDADALSGVGPDLDDAGPGGAETLGGDRAEPDPARPDDPYDLDPAARPDPASRLDAAREAGGAAAPASGREDAGPGSGL